jgi:hypothetical protein
MKALRSGLVIFSAVLVGFVLGAYLYRPSPVHAQNIGGGIRMQKVTEGYNIVIGSQVMAFSCTQENCFIAVRP